MAQLNGSSQPSETHPLTNPWKAVLVGGATGTLFGLAGFFIARVPGSGAMGTVMFCLVPFAAGIAIALVTPAGWSDRPIVAAAWLALIASLAALVATGKEGVVCVLMAFPLIFLALFVGVVIGYFVRKVATSVNRQRRTLNSMIILAALPLLIFAGHRAELPKLVHARSETITTTIVLAAEPEQVWANIQSLDSLTGRKPFLMYVGLPIPQRCVLEGTKLGSKRICYFDHGYIEESILGWDPPHRMRLSIDRTNLPGRHWLEFEGAEYDLRADGNTTVLTRTTTIASDLYPAWYWQRLEIWGVSSEHEYLFSDLARRFAVSRVR